MVKTLSNQNPSSKPATAFNLSRLAQLNPVWLLLGGLIILPPLGMLLVIFSISNNMPVFDSWQIAGQILKLHTGGLTRDDLWTPYLEHRIPVLRLLSMGLAWPFGWNIDIERLAGFGMQLITLFVLGRLLNFTLPGKPLSTARLGLLALFSLLLFSAIQWESWTHTINIVWFLLLLTTIVAVWVTNRWAGKGLGLAMAGVCALIASFTLLSGLLLWFLILFGLLVRRQEWRGRYIALWSAVTIAVYGTYFYGYQANSFNPEPYFFIKKPLEFVAFIFSYIGLPLRFWVGSDNTAFWWGIGGVLALAGFGGWFWYKSRRAKDGKWRQLLPWAQLCLIVLAMATITAAGRGFLDMDKAIPIVGRYVSIASAFWIGLFGVLHLALSDLYQTAGPKTRLVIGTSIGLTLTAGLLCYIGGNLQCFNLIEEDRLKAEYGRSVLYDYSSLPFELIDEISYQVGLKQVFYGLEQYQEGPFRTPPEIYRREVAEKWRKRLAPTNVQVSGYPSQAFQMVRGEKSSLVYASERLDFTAIGTLGAVFQVETVGLQAMRPTSWRDWGVQVVDLQAKTALYAIVEWQSDGRILWRKIALKASEEADGWNHFRMFAPPKLKSFTLTLFYRTGRPNQDSLKMAVYNLH